MRLKLFVITTICLLMVFATTVFFWSPNKIFSVGQAPVLTLYGDDQLGDGGNNDPYDSLVVINAQHSPSNADSYIVEYRLGDSTEDWKTITPQVKDVSNQEKQFFWSTSKIPSGEIRLRVAYVYNSNTSAYAYVTLNLSHEAIGRRGSYFVEDFSTSNWLASVSNVSWSNTGSARLTSGTSGSVTTSNLASATSGTVIKVALQPVLSDFFDDQSIRFQVSSDGAHWYGSTGENTFVTFTGFAPTAKTVTISANAGKQVFWRAYFDKGGESSAMPELFKLRLQWEVNNSPISCFTISPQTSTNPNQSFLFDASCSSDYNVGDALQYAWSWDDGETLTSYLSQVTTSHVFGTTSSSTVWLYVRDSYGNTASSSDFVNVDGIQDAVYGWAWNENYGWTSLNCDNVYYGENIDLCTNSTYKVMMNSNRTLTGWSWNSNLGWMCFGSTCSSYGLTPDGESPIAHYSMSDGQITGWGKYINYDSASNQGWMKFKGDKLNGETWCNSPTERVGENKCVHLNFSINGMSGWAWGSASANTDLIGPGWENYLGVINAPWFETKFSSIYGLKSVGSSNQYTPPANTNSATYCIWSDAKSGNGTITNMTSKSGCLKPNYSSNVKFPGEANKLTTVDGIFDVNKLIAQAGNDGTEYGIRDVGSILGSLESLDNKVYYFNGNDGDAFIGEELTIKNGKTSQSKGAGTVIINGDLRINKNIYYENSPVQYSKNNLATIAFIVKGDLIIDPTVDTISGIFIVLGSDGLQSCDPIVEKCGRFMSGNNASDAGLTVNGMVMARKFVLERTRNNNNGAAESFIYDGRVSINTPPGLSNVTKGLPIWREALISN
jgi:hypothetical protein